MESRASQDKTEREIDSGRGGVVFDVELISAHGEKAVALREHGQT